RPSAIASATAAASADPLKACGATTIRAGIGPTLAAHAAEPREIHLSKSPFQMRGVSIPLTRAAPLESEIACTRAAVAEIAPQWGELWAAAPRPRSPFLGPAWHLAWWRRIAAGTPE